MSIRARLFIGATAALGVWALAHALWHWQSVDLTRFICYLLIAVLASSLKIQLPGLDGTMSVNFLFILLSVLELNLPETLVIGCTATLAQCLFGTRQKLVPIKIVFNVFGMMANAIVLSYFAYHDFQPALGAGTLPLLVVTALVFFLANTVPVAVIISVTEGKPAHKVWAECHFWSFRQQARGMADFALSPAIDLLGLSLIPPLSRQVSDGKETSRDRKTPRRGDGLAALAHYRVACLGHRSQGSHFAQAPAACTCIRS
jgi:hypothetical protein